jgi:hypothetical protein
MLLRQPIFGFMKEIDMETLVQPSEPRSSVSEEAEGVRISIPSKWSTVVVFLGVWLTFWTIGGVSAARSLQRHFNLFLCFWLAGWTVGELAVTYAILYVIGGKEVILANSETLTCKRQIFGLGLAKSYVVREMRNLRFQPATGAGKSRRASRIAFDYGVKTITFGADLDEAEAVALIGRIRQRCPSADTSSVQGSGTRFWQPG